jgi:hypothetical protein
MSIDENNEDYLYNCNDPYCPLCHFNGDDIYDDEELDEDEL